MNNTTANAEILELFLKLQQYMQKLGYFEVYLFIQHAHLLFKDMSASSEEKNIRE